MLKIDYFYFFLSFCVGLIIVNCITPKPEIIIKYPTPYSANKQKYKDKTGNCFVYKAESVNCPTDKSLIKDHQIENFSPDK